MRHVNRSFRVFLAGLAFLLGPTSLAPAYAASITYTDPYCSQFFTVPGAAPGDVLLRCLKMTCSIAPVGSGYSVLNGATVTLQATCVNPPAQSFTWSLAVPPSSTLCPQPQPVAGDPSKITVMSATPRVCFYEVVTGDTLTQPSPNQGILRYGVAWNDPPPPPPAGCTASITSSTSLPSTGGAVNLTGGCTSGPITSWSWSRSGTVISGQQNPTDTLPANTTANPISYTYALTACNGVSCAAPVTATPGPVTVAGASVQAPTNCSIARTPTGGQLGNGGGSISMTASCTGTVTAYTWRKNAGAFGTSSATQNDTLNSNSLATPVTYTYDVTACNGSSCAAMVSTTFTVAGNVASAGFCGQFPNVLQVDLPWNATPNFVDTGSLGSFMADGVFVGRIVIPAGATSLQAQGQLSVVEYGDPQVRRVMTLSTQACDFRGFTPGAGGPVDPTGSTAPLKWVWMEVWPGFNYQLPDGTNLFNIRLQAGQTYFVNIRNRDGFTGNFSCPSSTCNIRVTHSNPR